MPRCSVCGANVSPQEGIHLANEEHRKRARGDFVCWSCWYEYLVDSLPVEDETTNPVDTPQLRALRKARGVKR